MVFGSESAGAKNSLGSWRCRDANPEFGDGWFLRRRLVRRRWSGCPAVLDRWFGGCRSDSVPSSSGDGRSPSPCRGAGQSGTAEPFTRFCTAPRQRRLRLRRLCGRRGSFLGSGFSGAGIRGRALRRRLTGNGSSERLPGPGRNCLRRSGLRFAAKRAAQRSEEDCKVGKVPSG